jgi:hypothetical protein
MGDRSFEVHDAPTLAPDYAALPPSKQLDSYTWAGSHIDLEGTLPGTTGIGDEMRTCGACKGGAVAFIYVHYFHHIVESDITVELLCDGCGRFTVHHYARP